MPASSSTTISPSISAEPRPSSASASAMPRNRAVQSSPCRVKQPHIAAVDAGLDAIAVVLDLVDPVRSGSAACRKGAARLGSRNVGSRPLRAPAILPMSGSSILRRLPAPARALWSSRSAPAAASSSLVRPLMREVVSSSVISGSPGWRANSSSALISSHGSVFSPRLGFMRTRCQRPLSRAPSRVNSRWPLASPLWGSPTGRPAAAIPHDHRAAAIFALRDVALEVRDTRSDGPRCAPRAASRPASGSGRA